MIESNFILQKLIPQRELEKKFIDTALSVIKKLQKELEQKKIKKDYEKITRLLDSEIKKTAIKYIKENPNAQKSYNLNHLEDNTETVQRKITQWRLATMGRLAELKVVNWKINDKGDSEYYLH